MKILIQFFITLSLFNKYFGKLKMRFGFTYNFFKLLITISIFILSSTSYAQKVIVSGQIKDISGNSLPFANIAIKGTTYGISSNKNGEFQLTIKPGKYKFLSSIIGYKTDTVEINIDKDYHNLNFFLKPITYIKSEVTVLPGKNPAIELMERALKFKNSMKNRIKQYEFNSYTKWIIKSDKNTKGNQISASIADSIDTTKYGIKGILENEGKGYFTSPDNYKEEIIARKQTSNIPPNINMISGQRVMKNFYDDNLEFLGQPLPSPLSKRALFYYWFNITDTLALDNKVVFKVHFEPDDENDPGFMGDLYIADNSYALIKVDVGINKAAGKDNMIKFEKVKILQQFLNFDNDIYMPVDLRLSTNMNIMGLIKIGIDINTIIHDYKINQSYTNDIANNVVLKVRPDADKKDSLYWTKTVTLPKTTDEIIAYKKLDSLSKIHDTVSVFSRLLAEKISLGNNFSLAGPLTLYKYNSIEGHNLSTGLYYFDKNNKRFSSDLEFSYGFEDKKAKENIDIKYLFGDYRNIKVTAGFKNDLVNTFYNEVKFSNLITTVYSLFFKKEYIDYFYKKSANINFLYEGWGYFDLGLGMEFRNDKTAYNNTNYSIFNKNKTFRTNSPIYECNQNLMSFIVKYDSRAFIEDGTYRKRAGDFEKYSIESKVILSDKSFNSDIDYLNVVSKFNTTFYNFGKSSSEIQIMYFYTNNALPVQNFYDIGGNIGGFGSSFTFRSLNLGEAYGDKILTAGIETYWDDELFRMFKIPYFKKSNYKLSTFYNIAWVETSNESKYFNRNVIGKYPLYNAKKPIQEIGFGIAYSFFPLKIDFAWQIDRNIGKDFSVSINAAL